MGEQRIIVDILTEDLPAVEEAAEKAHRSRKAQLEWIITDWVKRNNRNPQSKEKP